MTSPNPAFRFDTSHLQWTHNGNDPRFGYRIDYDVAVLGAEEHLGRMDLLIRWGPESYCHFHRHVGATTTLVLEGEHHVIDVDVDDDGKELAHEIRPAGTYRTSPGGDVHMERGGPEGSLVLFSMFEPRGQMFEILDDDQNVIAISTIESLIELSHRHAS